jgi:26S proteasome regulatory subunit N3
VKVKAMRFPPKSYNKDLESAEDRREREAQVGAGYFFHSYNF